MGARGQELGGEGGVKVGALRPSGSSVSVAILMGTFNGGKYLSEQLESIVRQVHGNWRLIASDDGSTDNTVALLERFQQVHGTAKVQIRRGPKSGFAQNFLAMACDSGIQADYYAFCDQDDVWLPEKLQRTIERLESEAGKVADKQDCPLLYCGRTAYVRDDLQIYSHSPLFVFPCSFRNALVQSIAGGNTMVFNQAVKTLLERTGRLPISSHDWWIYQLITGVGGRVFYDPQPLILYRQHEKALSGGNSSWSSKFSRLIRLLKGDFKLLLNRNSLCLDAVRPNLDGHALEVLNLFERMRKAKFKDRLRLFSVSGLYRQSLSGTLTLIFALLVGKL